MPEEQQQTEQESRYQLAFDVARHVNATLDAEEVMDRAVELLVSRVGAERGCVLLREDDGSLVPHALHRIDAEEAGTQRFRTSRAVLRAVESGEAVLTADAQTDPRTAGRASIVGLGLRSVLATPLKAGERFEGLIYLDSTSLDAFTKEDLDLVSFLAEIITIALSNARAHEEVRAARDTFSRYVNHQVVEASIASGGIEAAHVDVAVLESDMRGFSTVSRTMSAAEIVALLSTWQATAIDHVLDYGGNVDKFKGDAILAVFGAPVAVQGPVRRAVIAAVEMMGSIVELNTRRARAGEPELAIGTGIDFGEVIAGNVGSDRRLEYTVIGEPVNNAAWMASKAGRMEILVTAAAWEQLDVDIPILEERRLPFKGETEGHTVFAVDWPQMVG